MKMIDSYNKRQHGFGLIEVIVATAILAVVGASLLAGLTTGISGSHRVSQERTASDLARSQMEYVKEQPFSLIDCLDEVWTDDGDDATGTCTVIIDDREEEAGHDDTGSAQIVCAGTFNLGGNDRLAYQATDETIDLSTYDANADGNLNINLWIKASVGAPNAGDLQLILYDDNAGTSKIKEIDIPAPSSQWTQVTLTITNPDTLTTVNAIGIEAEADPIGWTIHIDDIEIGYAKIAEEDIPEGSSQDHIDISVESMSGVLQFVTITVSYSDDKTQILEGYKSRM